MMNDLFGANEINSRLFIGDQNDAKNIEALQNLQISRIVCLGVPPFFMDHPDFTYFQADVLDLPTENIMQHLDACNAFISDGVAKNTGTLVHCVHGQSRSAAVVTAWLMKTRQWTCVHAYEYVKQCRPFVEINPGFLNQLQLYERMQCSLNGQSQAHSEYQIMSLRLNPDTYENILKLTFKYPENWTKSIEDPSLNIRWYRCRKCRHRLFSELDIVPHSAPPSNFKHIKTLNSRTAKFHQRGTKAKKKTEEAESEERALRALVPCKAALCVGNDAVDIALNESQKVEATSDNCSSYFIQPIEWIQAQLLAVGASTSVKMHCPFGKCAAKIGCISLSHTLKCGCGAAVCSPAFQVVKCKIDQEMRII